MSNNSAIFAFSAAALEVASELSAIAENLEGLACSNSKPEDTYEEIVNELKAVEAIVKNSYTQLDFLYDRFLTFSANLGA